MRLLLRRRLDDDVLELPILAVMRKPLFGCPRFDNECETLLETFIGLLGRNAKTGELVMAITLADPKFETPIGH
jgi:hypothetical protein